MPRFCHVWLRHCLCKFAASLCQDIFTDQVTTSFALRAYPAHQNPRQNTLAPMPAFSLCAGGTDGQLLTFDLTTGAQVSSFQACSDTVNGLHFHPYLALAATASGMLSFMLKPLHPQSVLSLPLCHGLASSSHAIIYADLHVVKTAS